jgi:hypothetical protein
LLSNIERCGPKARGAKPARDPPWQLVDAGGAQDSTEASHARIVSARLKDRAPVFEYAHCSELKNRELSTIEPYPSLREDRWSSGFQFNQASQRSRYREGTRLPFD